MKTQMLSVLTVLFSIYSFSQNYPFSVNKTGAGNQAIVFIPGFASSGEVWNETADQLGKEYISYILTMPGFAGEKPEENPSFESWKTAIVHFIRQEKIEKPILIGHSMGGIWALSIAAGYPELLRKVIVVDALPCLPALSNPAFKSEAIPDCTPMIRQMTDMSELQFTQIQQMSMPSLSSTPEKYEEMVKWSRLSDRKTLAKLYCDFLNTDIRTDLKNISIPVLILLQPYFKNIAESIDSQYRNLKTGQIKYAEKGLHFIMYDSKEWYLTELNAFIK